MTTADATGEADTKRRINLAPVQKFGRSLMLPIAALPVAALMLRLGQPDLLGADGLGWDKVAAVVGAGGDALFTNLPLLFAVGVAIGMARKADGSTALAAVVGYLVFKGVSDAVSPFVLPLPPQPRPSPGSGSSSPTTAALRPPPTHPRAHLHARDVRHGQQRHARLVKAQDHIGAQLNTQPHERLEVLEVDRHI
jgi:hypothetical protein